MSRPATLKIRTTASETSGPMPSPGISVMTCDIQWTCFGSGLAHARCEKRRDAFRAATRSAVAERRGLIAVDVDLAEDLAAQHDRHDDLRLRLEAARQIPRVGIHVVDDDRFLVRWRRRRRCRGRAGCACAATACRQTARAPARRLRAGRCRPTYSRAFRPRAAGRPLPSRAPGRARWRSRSLSRNSVVMRHRLVSPAVSILRVRTTSDQPAEERHQLDERRLPVQPAELDPPGIARGQARRRDADTDRVLHALDAAREDHARVERRRRASARARPSRTAKRRGRGPSTARAASATRINAPAAVADEVKAPQDFAEDRAGQHPAVGDLARATTSKIAGAATAPRASSPPIQTAIARTVANRSTSIPIIIIDR